MPYKRDQSQTRSTSIWEYKRDHTTTSDDLLLVQFENGQSVCISWQTLPDVQHAAAWRLDDALMPDNLSDLRMIQGLVEGMPSSSFRVAETSGFLGQPLVLEMESADGDHVSLRFHTVSSVAAIRQVPRSAAVASKQLSGNT